MKNAVPWLSIRRNATPFWLFFDKKIAFSLVFYEKGYDSI